LTQRLVEAGPLPGHSPRGPYYPRGWQHRVL
jgi:hypothetical protein